MPTRQRAGSRDEVQVLCYNGGSLRKGSLCSSSALPSGLCRGGSAVARQERGEAAEGSRLQPPQRADGVEGANVARQGARTLMPMVACCPKKLCARRDVEHAARRRKKGLFTMHTHDPQRPPPATPRDILLLSPCPLPGYGVAFRAPSVRLPASLPAPRPPLAR
jgi:hypothetical protein